MSRRSTSSHSVSLLNLLTRHENLVNIHFPITISDVYTSIEKKAWDLNSLLYSSDIYICDAKSVERAKEIMKIPLYLTKNEPELRRVFNLYINSFPLSSIASKHRRCRVIIKDDGSSDHEYWLTWIEKLLLTCIVLFIGRKFSFSTPSSGLVVPGVIRALVNRCGLRAKDSIFMPTIDEARKKESDNERVRVRIFDGILNWDYWRQCVKYDQVKQEEDADSRVSVHSELYYIMMIVHILQNDKVNRKHYLGWIRTLMQCEIRGTNKNSESSDPIPLYKRCIDDLVLNVDTKRKESALFQKAVTILSFLTTGRKTFRSISLDPDDTHSDAIDPYIQQLPVASPYAEFIHKATNGESKDGDPGSEALTEVTPHEVAAVDHIRLVELLTANCELSLLERIDATFFRKKDDKNKTVKEPNGNIYAERFSFVFVADHLAVILKRYLLYVIGLFNLDQASPDGYKLNCLIIHDVYYQATDDVRVLLVVPKEILMLVQYYGVILSMRNVIHVPYASSPFLSHIGIFPLLSCVMNIAKKSRAQCTLDSFHEYHIYPVLVMLRALLLDSNHARMSFIQKNQLVAHSRMLGHLFSFIIPRLHKFDTPINVGEFLLTWMILPFVNVRTRTAPAAKLGRSILNYVLSDEFEKRASSAPPGVIAQILPQAHADITEAWEFVQVNEEIEPSIATFEDLPDYMTLVTPMNKLLKLCTEKDDSVSNSKPMVHEDYLLSTFLVPNARLSISRRSYSSMFPFHSRVCTIGAVNRCPNGIYTDPVSFAQKKRDRGANPIPSIEYMHIIKCVALATGVSITDDDFYQDLMLSTAVANASVNGENIQTSLFLPLFKQDGSVIHPLVQSLLSESSKKHTATSTVYEKFKPRESSSNKKAKLATDVNTSPSTYPVDSNGRTIYEPSPSPVMQPRTTAELDRANEEWENYQISREEQGESSNEDEEEGGERKLEENHKHKKVSK